MASAPVRRAASMTLSASRYDSAGGGGPSSTASLASCTNGRSVSASECTAIVRRPIRPAVRSTRRAISPRLATSRDSNTPIDALSRRSGSRGRRLTGVGLTIVVLVGAVAVGYALNGTWSGLTTLRLRWRRMVVAAVLAQTGGAALGILGVTDARRGYVVGLALSAICAAAFCTGNLRVPGVPLVTLGLIANAVVVTLNGAMPVSIVAALRAGVPITDIAAGYDARHEIAVDRTTWRSLGDVVPLPLPVRPEVVSPGDVLVAAGLGELVVMGMLRRRPSPPGRRRAVMEGDHPTEE